MQQAPKKTEQIKFIQNWEEGTLSRFEQKESEYLDTLICRIYFVLAGAGLFFLIQLACFVSRQDNGWSLVLQSLRDTFLP